MCLSPLFPRAIKAITAAIARTLTVLLLTAQEVPEDCDYVVDGLLFPCLDWRGHRDLWSVKHKRVGMNDPDPGSARRKVRVGSGPPIRGPCTTWPHQAPSGLLEGMDPSGWIGDKGYVGRGMIAPHKKPPNGEPGEAAKEENKSVNRIRQVVERTVAHIKSWRILHTPYRRPLETFEQTITAALALYAFKTTP